MAPRILAVGEILFDVFPDRRVLGGAPANFAYMAHRLGADSHLISRVADDADGKRALAELTEIGLSIKGVQVAPSPPPTGLVDVTVAGGQPSYVIKTNTAWDEIAVDETAIALARSCNVLCFGTLAQRKEPSASSIRQIVAAASPYTLRILDINLRKPMVSAEIIQQSLQLAVALKLNSDELPVLAEMLSLTSFTEKGQIAELAERYGFQLVVLTRGDAGSLLYSNRQVDEHPGVKVKIVDAVGAGDAFTAATTIGFLRGWRLSKINEIANQIAAYVCTQPGATPPIPPELRKHFEG
ncbi:carbohydrate kinase family protein [Humisphaera borealis]|uniref:Carbohydrate kinase n=1 Tax=Humisphaera borealis TaxID=2807512 RepID=A0A7M2WYA4_9BACT|nr:carbohydrate kinase [Humisphaera borealis]QOV90497.1 carbohydrate kinase [Humisphaera borealis]